MIEQVKSELLYILKTAPKIIDNTAELSELSNYSIHSASIYQDSDSLSIAIIIYSLSKMISRYQAHELPNWAEIYSKIMKEMKQARTDLEADNVNDYRNHIKNIMGIISKCDKNIKLYIDKVIEKAKIKKGTKLFEHGVSAERAAKLMGISVWEMMNYIGKTEIIDKESIKTDVKKRLLFAKKIFNIKK